ncbi:MAG: hypothetical protein LUQ50_10290 [Methanospirillum sp.]|uniref:hypothetical protein n=1 Tax=Methanospirillum sp. TaxID=45200 RepID=UPI0023725F27|nr:hypothetical protein [Methanospirillum sp.]MDD1729447.1 hypothetical protein [Methanospirillum sp.]
MKGAFILRVLTLVLVLIVGISLPGTSDSGLQYPLNPSPSTGPYDDQKFMDIATTQIMGFSGKTLPTEGNELLNLKSVQMELSRMNISPDFYPRASLVNAYLYNLSQAGDAYGTTKSLTDHPSTLGSPIYDQYSKARGIFANALKTWSEIKDLFPKAIPPSLPDPTLPIRPSQEQVISSDSVFKNQ